MNLRLASTEALNLLAQLPGCEVKTVAILTICVYMSTFASDYMSTTDAGELQSNIYFVVEFSMPGGLRSITFHYLPSDEAKCQY